ncbi:MAG: substrate-binding domain-containing protein [Bacteroidetes bacterium]|nr:substrate-binding domain-containing protein [Bacteroidota bacterium]
MKNNKRFKFQVSGFFAGASCVLYLVSFISMYGCSDYFKNDYEDNTPTSGKLKVYYDEGLRSHVENQVYTFEALYGNANIELFSVTENEAVQALYSDSCEAIVISRNLNEKEKQAFSSKSYTPNPTAVAKSGIALITNINTPVKNLSYEQIVELLSKELKTKDSLNNETKMKVLFDKNNSSVMFYLRDSLLKGAAFSPDCSVLGSSLESINYVAANKNTIAFIDFAWLSDVDDSLFKANLGKIKFIPVGQKNTNDQFELPSQSSFKLNTYPFTRTVYVIKKTGEFSLAKGFETFVAGPKGQTTFLKQGLLPTKQQERSIEVKLK